MLDRLLYVNDHNTAAAWLCLEFFPNVAFHEAQRWVWQRPAGFASEAYWRCYFKTQAIDAGCFPCGHRGAPQVRFTVPLHFFEIYINETQEQLKRLPEGNYLVTGLRESVSKIFSTNNYVRPIDRVAARVASDDRRKYVQAKARAKERRKAGADDSCSSGQGRNEGC